MSANRKPIGSFECPANSAAIVKQLARINAPLSVPAAEALAGTIRSASSGIIRYEARYVEFDSWHDPAGRRCRVKLWAERESP